MGKFICQLHVRWILFERRLPWENIAFTSPHLRARRLRKSVICNYHIFRSVFLLYGLRFVTTETGTGGDTRESFTRLSGALYVRESVERLRLAWVGWWMTFALLYIST